MDIFSQVEGLSGENLGSALLRYLVFSSHEVRDSILSLLSDHSPSGPISYANHFACRTEYPTRNDELGDGRLDVLIQLDDVVIGIENKFFAEFQDNQPQKYVETLKSVAAALESINHSDVRVLLFVLCPEVRQKDARRKVESLNNVTVITWEEILRRLESVGTISNPVAKVIRDEFISYLRRHFSFIHDFDNKVAHLRKAFPEYGSSLQYEFVSKLCPLLPAPGPRLSKGATWLGYYFFAHPEIKEKGWIGFVPPNEKIVYETDNQAELLVASTYKASLPKEFVEVELKDSNFIGAPGRTNAWVVKFDSSWNSVEKWREKLAPFWKAVGEDSV
jgi:hypothetical protein